MRLLIIICIITLHSCITIQPCTCPQQPITGSLEEISLLPNYQPIYRFDTTDTKWLNPYRIDTTLNLRYLSSDTLRTARASYGIGSILGIDSTFIIKSIK